MGDTTAGFSPEQDIPLRGPAADEGATKGKHLQLQATPHLDWGESPGAPGD